MTGSGSSTDYNGYLLVVVAITLLTLTYISIVLRFFVRLKITKAFAADDWLMLVAQIIFTLSCSFILLGIHYGIGRHNADLTLSNQIEGMKWEVFASLSYIANMLFIKLSIALFLLRIAVQRRYVWIIRISMVIIAICSVVIWFCGLFQCIPVQAQWDFTIQGAKCMPQRYFIATAYSISVMTILSDWFYALLPIPMIWSVQMSIQTKVTVAFILSLGIFASVATLIRIKYILVLRNDSDILYKATTALVWTLVEPGVAITAACFVTIRPLLRTLEMRGFESTPAGQNTPLTLRDDITGGHWSIISHGKDGQGQSHKRNLSVSALERLNGSGSQITSERSAGEGEVEEYEMDESGITKTVHVNVVHGQASSFLKTGL